MDDSAAGACSFFSSNEMSGRLELEAAEVPPRSKSSAGAAVTAAAATAAAAPPLPYSPLLGSIERPSAAALSHSGPEPPVRFFTLSAVSSKARASFRLA